MPPSYDYIIIGSGIAGLFTALHAREHGRVLVITKGNLEDNNSRWAQGGIAAALGPDDSPDMHMQDTLQAGAGLCDPEAVRVLVTEGPQRIADLIRLGVPFDTLHGEIALAREGAHSRPRVLHAGGDATGAYIEMTLVGAIRGHTVHIVEQSMVTRILVDEASGVAIGVEAMDSRTGVRQEYRGRHIVLATGGAGRLFRYTTNPDVATGDGVALAFRAGAQVMDMEFFQFHPTALRLPGAPPFLISEAVRGEGGRLCTPDGTPFMHAYHPQGDLAPRDVVARAILTEMQKAGTSYVLLDITHLPPQRITSRFPTIYRTCLQYGLDITRQPIPVAPAAHYMMGGVKTDLWGQTTIPNLYACGECACVGVHGANRLASNSLLETVVFSHRVVRRTLGEGADAPPHHRPEVVYRLERRDVPCADIPPLTLRHLQDLMWEMVGLVRNGEGLLRACRVLAAWERTLPPPTERHSQELAHMVVVGRLMAEAAVRRTESRGAHFRTDYPHTDPAWQKHIVLVQ
ncbi:MAG: L-aspartate oxidase [Dehalococcoidia bacterium]|nr:L-aspartate oxidase [Dehalococcoidia bacterium]MDW8119549.1 L-aspartate oxidase [Chloroflexota bacterium]